MTMVSFPGTPLLWPGPFHEDTLAAFGSTGTLDAAGDVIGFEVESVDTCERVHISIHAAAT